jgi:hypothetical protein
VAKRSRRVLEDVEKFKKPFKYEHKQGAIWVDV